MQSTDPTALNGHNSQVRVGVDHKCDFTAITLPVTQIFRHRSLIHIPSRTSLPGWKIEAKWRLTVVVSRSSKPRVQFFFVLGIVELAVDERDGVPACARKPGVFVWLHEVEYLENEFRWQAEERARIHSWRSVAVITNRRRRRKLHTLHTCNISRPILPPAAPLASRSSFSCSGISMSDSCREEAEVLAWLNEVQDPENKFCRE
jgi:hypothetical protein